MACGDSYASEVVTVDGYTVKNPYGVVALPGDYTGWRQLAERIWDRLDARWQQLGRAEPKPYDFWNANVELKNELTGRVEELPSTFVASTTGAGITGGIDDAVKVIVDMNCFRERVDKRLRELEVEPVDLPGAGVPAPSSGGEYIFGVHLGWWLAAAVGVGGYLYFKSGKDE